MKSKDHRILKAIFLTIFLVAGFFSVNVKKAEAQLTGQITASNLSSVGYLTGIVNGISGVLYTVTGVTKYTDGFNIGVKFDIQSNSSAAIWSNLKGGQTAQNSQAAMIVILSNEAGGPQFVGVVPVPIDTSNAVTQRTMPSGPPNFTLTPAKNYIIALVIIDSNNKMHLMDTQTAQTSPASGTSLSSAPAINIYSGQVQSVAQTDPKTGLPSCGFISADSSIMGCVAQIIYYVIFTPTSVVMALAGNIMDWGIGYSINSSSYPVSDHSFVTDGWRIMRDLANIFFIFILVFVAITTILGQKKERLIGMVILVALTINFSLFLTKVIVDFGNITSRFFYNSITVKSTQGTQQEIKAPSGDKGISVAFAAKFNPIKIFDGIADTMTIDSPAGPISTGTQMSAGEFAGYYALFSFVGAIVNLVAAYVFFSLAWLFIARTAGIWLAMIFAPLAFLSLAMPALKTVGGQAGKKYLDFDAWLKSLVEMSIMPVIAMLMIYLIISFLNGPSLVGSIGNQTTTGRFMIVLIPLAVISFLLLKTKSMAESLAGDFGETLGKVGSFVGGAALGIATGGASMIGRKYIGGVAGNAMLSRGEKWANSKNSLVRAAGRNMALVGDKAQKATYDMRNTKLGDAVGKGTGYNMNQTLGLKSFRKEELKGGYVEQKKKQVEKEMAVTKLLEVRDTNKLKTDLSDLELKKKKIDQEADEASVKVREIEKAKGITADDDEETRKAKGGSELKDAEAVKAAAKAKSKSAKDDVEDQIKKIGFENNQRKERYAKDLESSNYLEVQMAGGAAGKAAAGAAIGAVAGSFVPVLGTAVGAALGAKIGAGVGAFTKATTFSGKARKESINKIRKNQKASKTDQEILADELKKVMGKDEKAEDKKDKKKDDKKDSGNENNNANSQNNNSNYQPFGRGYNSSFSEPIINPVQPAQKPPSPDNSQNQPDVFAPNDKKTFPDGPDTGTNPTTTNGTSTGTSSGTGGITENPQTTTNAPVATTSNTAGIEVNPQTTTNPTPLVTTGETVIKTGETKPADNKDKANNIVMANKFGTVESKPTEVPKIVVVNSNADVTNAVKNTPNIPSGNEPKPETQTVEKTESGGPRASAPMVNYTYKGSGGSESTGKGVDGISGVDEHKKDIGDSKVINLKGDSSTPQINISNSKIDLNVGGGVGKGEIWKKAYRETQVGYKPDQTSNRDMRNQSTTSGADQNRAFSTVNEIAKTARTTGNTVSTTGKVASNNSTASNTKNTVIPERKEVQGFMRREPAEGPAQATPPIKPAGNTEPTTEPTTDMGISNANTEMNTTNTNTTTETTTDTSKTNTTYNPFGPSSTT